MIAVGKNFFSSYEIASRVLSEIEVSPEKIGCLQLCRSFAGASTDAADDLLPKTPMMTRKG